jgi:ribosomal protein S18 acetylase RimI-like enzyme
VALVDDAEGERFAAMVERHIGERVRHVIAGMQETEAHRPTEPHFSLHSLVVDASAQGRGLGGGSSRRCSPAATRTACRPT